MGVGGGGWGGGGGGRWVGLIESGCIGRLYVWGRGGDWTFTGRGGGQGHGGGGGV